MSYDLEFDCGPLDAPHDIKGGTYAMGGTSEPILNITYNYSSHFRDALGEGGIQSLYGLNAETVISRLDEVIPTMRGVPDDDYWAATEGNAKAALASLRAIAKLCPPTAILSGD